MARRPRRRAGRSAARRAGALTGAFVAAVFILCASVVITAANAVPGTKASNTSRTISANDLKPTECNGITLTAKVTGSGTINGTNAAELIIGSASIDSISASGGTDCALGGDLADTVQGGAGNDVLLGGSGADTIDGGSGTDVCYGGADTDIFLSCGTQVQ